MQIIGNHSDDHVAVIAHLALNMVIVSAAYQERDICQLGAGRQVRILLVGGVFRGQQPDRSSLRVFLLADFFEKGEELLRHGVDDCLENLIPQLGAVKRQRFCHNFVPFLKVFLRKHHIVRLVSISGSARLWQKYG